MRNQNRYKLPLICSAVLLVVIIAGAQEPAKSVARLKLEHNRLAAILVDKSTSSEIRELNRQLLVKNEALMRAAILRSIADLEAYAQNNADILDTADRSDINERIEAYRYDLAQLNGNGKLPIPKQFLNDTTAKANAKQNDEPTLIESFSPPSTDLFRNTANAVAQPYSTTNNSPVPLDQFPDRGSVLTTEKYTEPKASSLNQFTLTLEFIGNNGGAGIIHDDQSDGMNCDSACSKDYPAGTVVTLSYQPTGGSQFVNWGGDCAGATCKLLMDRARDVTVTFRGAPPKPVVANAKSDNESDQYDWGRVHAYFTSGVILSKDRDITSTERNSFSKPDIYLDFTIDSNWRTNRPDGKRFLGIFNNVNTFFSARLTAVPVTNALVATPSSARLFGPSPSPTPQCASAECATFLTSEKAAKMEAGTYFPIEIGEWTFSGDNHRHALFVAPLIKGGIQTITGDRRSSTAEARRFGGDDIYNSFSLGAMFGHYKKSGDPDVAPELINWLTITRGRFENFEYLDTDGPRDSDGNYLVRRRPWRYEATGMLKIPKTAFVIGFNGNFGKGPDDLRFLFGLRFDIAKVLEKLSPSTK